MSFNYEQYTPKGEFENSVYTPQFTEEVSNAVRRLAWSLKKPMTKTIRLLVLALPAIIDKTKICQACKDKTDCNACIFNRYYTAEEKAALLAAL